MLNEKLIADAIKIVIEYFEAEGIQEQTVSIRTRAIDWYNNTEIVEPYQLAAVVIYGKFVPTITYKEIKRIEEHYFPSDRDINFSIEEIEMSLYDMFR